MKYPFMAIHITHIILTELVYEDLFQDCSKKDFTLGTLLPDIRYLDKTIPREQFHIKNISLKTVLSLNDCFQKWFYFHSLLDQLRDEFYISRGIYVFGWDENFIMALKLLEDQYFYGKIKNRDEYIKFFDDIPYKNIPNIQKEIVDKWYMMIKNWILRKPDDTARRAFQSELWLPENYTNKINSIIDKLQKDKKIIKLMDELYTSFKDMIQNW